VARWLGRIKAAAARVNAELGLLDADKAERITIAADRIAAGEFDDQFPVDVFQTGSGTSSNMNANEVIASLARHAGVDVHPNDHVNASQSSNDVFPTTIHVAATEALAVDVAPALDHLAAALRRRSEDWAEVVKSAAGPARPPTAPTASATPSPAWPSCRSAGPPSGPG
jgi:fumarate hydratase class II